MSALLFRTLIVVLSALTLIRPTAELISIIQFGALSAGLIYQVLTSLKLLNAALGAFIAIGLAAYAPRQASARALAVLTVLWPATLGVTGAVPGDPTLQRLDVVLDFSSALFAVAAFLRLTAVFPKPIGAEAAGGGVLEKFAAVMRRVSRHAVAVWAGAAAVMTVAIVSAILPAGTFRIVLESAVGIFAALTIPTALYAGLLNLRSSYKASSANDQKKIFWLAEGLLVFSLGFFILPFLLLPVFVILQAAGVMPRTGGEWFHPLLQGVTMIIALACMALAMFYDGALDPRIVVRKTTLYSALTITGVFVFAAAESVVAKVIAGVAGQWLSAGIAAVFVLPLHNWARSRVSRLIRDSSTV